jgi:hypothetical protein
VAVRWALQAAVWTLLAGWFGAFSFFALVIAPTAFQVLPSQAVAGALVAPALASLHTYGLFAGPSLALLAAVLRRGWLAIALPLALAVTCAVSEYGVTRAIDQVRPHAFGEDYEPRAAELFSRLHQTSRTLFGVVQFGALGLILIHARPAAPQPPPDPSLLST